jgi:hypothetical protein
LISPTRGLSSQSHSTALATAGTTAGMKNTERKNDRPRIFWFSSMANSNASNKPALRPANSRR